MSREIPDAETQGEWIGLARLRGEGTERFLTVFDEILSSEGGEQLSLAAVFDRLAQLSSATGDPVRVIYVQRDWVDINSLADVARGGAL